MRIMIAGLMAWLMIATAVSAAEKPWDFVVEAPVTVQPAPMAAKPKSVSLVRVFVDMAPGQPWAKSYQLSDPRGGILIGNSYLHWEGERSDVSINNLAPEFGQVVAASGFAAPQRRDLFETESKTDLQIGAVITDIAARFCWGCGLMLSTDHARGGSTMSVEWQIYSPIERRVLATVKTRGAYETREHRPGAGHILNGAFRENVRKLVNAREFRDVVLGETTSAAPVAQPLTAIAFTRAPAAPRSIPDTTKSVVSVFSNSGMGSGFLVSADGYVLTNQHVVGDSRFVKLKWADGTESLGDVVRVDRRRDIALIKTSAVKSAALVLRGAAPQVGEAVYAVGTPLDDKFQGSVTRGIVSATRIYDGLPFIQSDAVINSGNSGGPLLDENGAVIGVCVSGYEVNGAPAGINLFIPIDDALKALALTPAG